jgi:hypothetical protein
MSLQFLLLPNIDCLPHAEHCVRGCIWQLGKVKTVNRFNSLELERRGVEIYWGRMNSVRCQAFSLLFARKVRHKFPFLYHRLLLMLHCVILWEFDWIVIHKYCLLNNTTQSYGLWQPVPVRYRTRETIVVLIESYKEGKWKNACAVIACLSNTC